MNSIIETLVEVQLPNSDAFLKIKETLTRIGISGRADEGSGKRKLYQSCHILHKKGKYYIVHFKELFALDGRDSLMDEKDFARRNKIAKLLQDWNLLTVVNEGALETPATEGALFRIVKFSEKANWELVAKYSIGADNKEPV